MQASYLNRLSNIKMLQTSEYKLVEKSYSIGRYCAKRTDGSNLQLLPLSKDVADITLM